ncbi:MAG: phosphopantetheine-binding protein [Pseudomonadota bacterium]
MTSGNNANSIKTIITQMLEERGKAPSLQPDDALFTSGLLDSLAATELMMTLETDFGIDLADADFDIGQLDTLADLEKLVSA